MEQETTKKKEAVGFFLSKGILLSPDILQTEGDPDTIYSNITKKIDKKDFLVLSKDVNELLTTNQDIDANWSELERAKAILEKGRGDKLYKEFLEYINKTKKPEEKTISRLEAAFFPGNKEAFGRGNVWRVLAHSML